MDTARIENEMRELESKLNYKFKDISWLAKAMASIKIKAKGEGDNHSEYLNEGLATVGDSLISFALADELYKDGITIKGDITIKRSSLENNDVMYKVMLNERFINYAYNDKHFYKDDNIPQHEKVVCNNYDTYIEAITAAIYYDSNYATVRKWIIEKLKPLLRKNA